MRSEEQTQLKRRCLLQKALSLGCLCLLIPHSSLLTVSAKQPSKKAENFEREKYYKAKGFDVEVRWEVPRKTVAEGRDLVATLIITGATNPTAVERPDLKNLPEFAKRFTVTDVTGPPVADGAKEVRFTYKLRPRNREVNKVPTFECYYFNLAAAPTASQFRYITASAVPITVTEPPKVEVPAPVPLEAPEFLFRTEKGPSVLEGAPFVPSLQGWVVMLLVGPLAALGWYLVWRRVYPDGARLARMRRSRAARRALDTIRKAARTPDPPATVGAAVLQYLRARFPLPEGAATPSEIGAALTELNVPEDVAEQTANVFRDCDRARFAPPSDSGLSLASDAEALVVRLEELA